jgi:hypothetical protein
VLPNDEKIYKSLVLIKNRLSAIEWTVIIDE